MNATLVWLSDLASPLGATVMLRGSAILLAAALLARLLARTSAATRSAVWALAFVALAATPVAMRILPPWTAASPWPAAPVPHVAVHISASIAAGDARSLGVDPAAPFDRVRASEPHPATPRGTTPLSALLALAWLIGVAALLARLGTHAVLAARVRHSATPFRDGRVSNLLREIGNPDVRVVISDETAVPLVSGVRRPTLVLPAGALDWSGDLLRAVLLHELAHVERRDLAMHLMTRVAVALYWPNPLVWLAARRLATEQERACDDRAMRGSEPQAYAGHLLEVAELLRAGGAPSGALTMATRRGLIERIRSILNPDADRQPLSRRRLSLVAVLLALVAVPVIALRVRQAPAPDPHLFTALSSAEVHLRLRAAWGLGEFESRTGVAPLLERLNDPHPAVRGAVIWALGEIKDVRGVGPLIDRVRQDADPLVREMAVLALGEIGARRAVTPLVASARREPAVLPAVLWALGEIRDPSAAAALRELRFAVPDAGNWGDGREFSNRVERDRRLEPAAVDSAITALASDEREVRTHAAWSLGRIGDPRGVSALLAAMRDPERDVRAMAVWALDEINPSRDSH